MAHELFKKKAPGIMRQLIADFNWGDTPEEEVLGTAAVLGNAGAESGGFVHFQELKPTSGRGGWGWFQWTGPRRKAFEAYCKRNNLDPKSDKANYGWLWVELTGPEKKAVEAVRNAQGLEGKTKAFELAFERAGVKNYEARYKYAQEALTAYGKGDDVVVIPSPPPTPPNDATNMGIGAALMALVTFLFGVAVYMFGG